jgi:hypothetical protein
MTAKKSVKKSTATKVVKEKVLIVTDKEISYDEIWQWVQENAGGNEANVHIAICENVDMGSAQPVPFGYGGKTGGVRQQIQDWILYGVDGDTSLKAFLNKAAPLGHSRKKPVCLHALMHGGYSPSSKYWMTPFIQLVVKGYVEHQG